MRVLIAEDDNTSRLILDTMLQKWGCDVVSTTNGEEAWEVLCQASAPSIAILDWMMPSMDGVELCRRFRETYPHTPAYFILLTALDRKEHVVAGLEAGANDYITKPFDKDELRARLRVGERVLELQQALARRVEELQDALQHVRTLQGILPICTHCHRIRTDKESWERIETYISAHTDALFSHGFCPDCVKKYYSEEVQ